MEGDNAPEFHDRFSIHPQSVEFCRAILLRVAGGSAGAEEEVEALSDWQAVRRVENLRKTIESVTKASQGLTRACKGTAARLATLPELLAPITAAEGAEELELFLAIDHPA